MDAGRHRRSRRAGRVVSVVLSVVVAATLGACSAPGRAGVNEIGTPVTTSDAPATTDVPTTSDAPATSDASAQTQPAPSAEPSPTPEPTDPPADTAPPSPEPRSPGVAEPTGAPPSAAPSPSPRAPSPEPTTSAPPAGVPSPPLAPPLGRTSPVPAAWRGQDVEVLPTDRPVVALTFDGGGSSAGVTSILATLDRYDVPATFFVTGSFARAYPSAVRAMAAAGHPVGNHSDTHPSFPDSTNAVIRDQLARADASISPLSGESTKPLFRFPFGARTPLDIEVVNDAGYVPFRWTVDTLGWKGTTVGGITADTVRQRVLDTARPGQIVLMHLGANPDDGTTLDADALPGIIEGLRAQGYGFVTLREFVG